MTEYISTPLPNDQPAVRQVIDDALTAQFGGALAVPPGSLLDFLADTFAGISAQDRQLLTSEMSSVFKYSGAKIDRVPQNEAIPATGDSTWVRTGADAALGARTVTGGTEITLTGADGQPVSFLTTADFTFASGITATADGAVGLVASVAGTAGNGLQSGATPALTTTWLQSVAVTAPTSGGVDAEDDDAYQNRLADTRPLQLNAIAKADDLARWLRNQPGVARALVLDNYNGAAGQPGHISAWVVDGSGDALSTDAMAALRLAAQDITLTNLIVHILAPTYTHLDIAWVGHAEAGWDVIDVEARAEADMLDYLNRAVWGASRSGDVLNWLDKRIARLQDVSTVLNNVQGFDHWDSLTINGGTSDVTLAGPGALPAADSIIESVVIAAS